MSFTKELIYILLPLILSNSIHMVIVKKDLFSSWKIPINKSLFGSNKTLRGFIIVPVLNFFLTAGILFLCNEFMLKHVLFGFIFGFFYMLSELPNSFLKRTIGISPGTQSVNNKWLFTFLDKTDSALGIAICYYFMISHSFLNSIILFLTGSAIHFLFSWILTALKIKKSF